MSPKCKICGSSAKKESYFLTSAHINTKTHQRALKTLENKKKPTSQFNDLVLFNSLNFLATPNFINIRAFCNSFGISSKEIYDILVRRIKIGDITYSHPFENEFDVLITDIINIPSVDFPLSINISDCSKFFPSLKLTNLDESLAKFKEFSKKYPEIFQISSSQLGFQPDLVSINSIFHSKLVFHPNKRWHSK